MVNRYWLLCTICSLQLFQCKLNAQSWFALGNGINETYNNIRAIAGYNGSIYVGGYNIDTTYSSAGENLIKWDGNTWSAVSGGVNSAVDAILEWNGSMYVAGGFDTAGGIRVNNIAKWDGSSWSALGNGIHGGLFCLAQWNGNLYAAGEFDSAGGIPARNVAKWNGVSWSALDSGILQNSFAMVGLDTGLYLNGSIGSSTTTHIWNGVSWSTTAAIPPPPVCLNSNYTTFQGLASYQGDIIESFNTDDVIDPCPGIAQLTGSYSPSVYQLCQDANGFVRLAGAPSQMVNNGNDLYIAAGQKAIAVFDGTSWSIPDSGLSYRGSGALVSAMAFYNGTLYVAGLFDSAGSISANNIAGYGSPLAINDIGNNTHINLSPNPSLEWWKLTVSADLIGAIAQIFDATGSLVDERVIKDNNTQITIGSALAGIYELRINTEHYSVVQKLVKM